MTTETELRTALTNRLQSEFFQDTPTATVGHVGRLVDLFLDESAEFGPKVIQVVWAQRKEDTPFTLCYEDITGSWHSEGVKSLKRIGLYLGNNEVLVGVPEEILRRLVQEPRSEVS